LYKLSKFVVHLQHILKHESVSLILLNSNLTVHDQARGKQNFPHIIPLTYGAGCCLFSAWWALSGPEFS